jgi:hypothetical protein
MFWQSCSSYNDTQLHMTFTAHPQASIQLNSFRQGVISCALWYNATIFSATGFPTFGLAAGLEVISLGRTQIQQSVYDVSMDQLVP